MKRIFWTQGALVNLENICDYIAKDDPDASRRVGELIISQTEMLTEFPFLGTKTIKKEIRRIVIPKTSYILYYRVKKNQIQILRILHKLQKRD